MVQTLFVRVKALIDYITSYFAFSRLKGACALVCVYVCVYTARLRAVCLTAKQIDAERSEHT